jgi:zinc transport system substrate-binding protein
MTKYFLFAGVKMQVRRILGWSILLSLVLSGCRTADDVWPRTGKKRVLASFPPLYCFTQNVAGDDVDVRCLLTLTGPHDFQWTSREILLRDKANLMLCNGLGLDEWATTQHAKKDPDHAKIVEVAELLPQDQLRAMSKDADDGHGHKHGEYDPHVWLGPPQAKTMVAKIADELSELDPAHKKGYQERAKAYSDKLDDLHEYGKTAFKAKKNRNIVTTHDSLGYFADAFGLKVVGTIQKKAGTDVDSRGFTELIKTCKDHDVSVIAVEPQYSKARAESLKRELDKKGIAVELIEIDPLETAPAAAGKADPDPGYYLATMRRNIDNLAKALP